MVDSVAAESLFSVGSQVVEVRAGSPALRPEQRPGPSPEQLAAATRLENGLKKGVDPKKLMEGFVEGYYEEDEGNKDKGRLESPRGKEETHVEDKSQKGEIPNEDGDKKGELEENRSEQPPTLEGIITAYQKGEIDLATLLDQYRELTGLRAINLEEDPRYKELFEEGMKKWLKDHPEPEGGSMEWRDWVSEEVVYREDKLPPIIAENFQKSRPEDFLKYQKYGIHLRRGDGKPSIESDPVWREMEAKARARGSKIAAWNKDLDFIDRKVTDALYDFCQKYPEKAKIYALFEGKGPLRITETLRIVNEAEKKRIDAGLPDSREADKKDQQQGGDGEKGEERGDRGDQQITETSDKPKTSEQRLAELQEEVEALREKIKGLRREMDELKASNLQVEEYLRKQGMLPDSYEEMKKENPFSALALALALLLGLSVSKIPKK